MEFSFLLGRGGEWEFLISFKKSFLVFWGFDEVLKR
jgi:hypothetical protein